MHKKDFITQRCINSHIIIEDSKETIRRIVDEIYDMQIALKEIAGQIQSGNFMLSDTGYQEIKQDDLAFMLTLVDISNLPICLRRNRSLAEEIGKQSWNWNSLRMYWSISKMKTKKMHRKNLKEVR